ncbi:MAG: substrate-binding domain-containing protein, partial [Bacteroidota bacterium]
MSSKSKKFVLMLLVSITIISMLAACGAPAPAPTTAPVATQPPAKTEAPAATQAPAEQKKFTIGISNPFISSEYRTQMIQELKDVNEEYKKQGITTDLVIESADTDTAGQIQQLQNLMAKNVDVILVNPGDVSGLNATLQEALDKGIIVISVDQELDVPGVYNVGIDQKEWAKTSADWLAKKLG